MPPNQNQQWLFVAAAKGLQGFVFRSDPLKEMVGGSELIELLPRTNNDGFLGKVLEKLNLKPEVLTDDAGAARMLFQSRDDADRLARLWPLLAAQYAPGLEMSVAVVEVEDGNLGKAIETAEREININRNYPAVSLPEAGPWVARNRRTGLPATNMVPALDEKDAKNELKDAVDAESKCKRAAAKISRSTLLDKIIPEKYKEEFNPEINNESAANHWTRWTVDLNKLATNENSYIAIIHADANGLGAAMMKCINALANNVEASMLYRQLCQDIEKATCEAAQKATTTLLEITPAQSDVIVPMRPLVCAGEDFTCIIRAEHAVRFAKEYLEELERKTEDYFEPLLEKIPGLQPFLTGCAGIVFCKSHFPFSRAYALAESLCGYAKKRTNRSASALAFVRLKYSMHPSNDYDEFIEHSFTGGKETEKVRLTMNPYLVGNVPANIILPKLADLAALADAMKQDSMPFSGQRELITSAYAGKTVATQEFDRLRLISRERNQNALDNFDKALNALTRNGLWKNDNDVSITPLYDALELIHLQSDLK